MYPSLSTRRRILAALLILGGKSTYSQLKSFLPLGYGGPKFYGMLRRLEKERLVRRSNGRTVRLLPAGIELLERRYGPRILRLTDKGYKSYKDYNQSSWSLVILNFPTSQAYVRSRLAGRLAELGCGPLRDGVYVSPYPILDLAAEWAEENRCLERVFLLPVTQGPTFASQRLGLFGLADLSRRYLSLLDRLNIAKGVAPVRKRERAIRRIKTDFLDLVIADPLLPKPLEAADWPRKRVIGVIGEMGGQDKDISTGEINIDNSSGQKSIKTGPKILPPRSKNSKN